MEADKNSVILHHPNGHKVYGVIHCPAAMVEKGAAVLICHGLGGNRIGKHRLYVELAKMLALQGIACLRIDFRGAGESDGDFTEMTIDTQVADALLALEHLISYPFVDRNRLGICGSSLGGVIAVKTAEEWGTIRSLALWAPFFSFDPWLARWQALCAAVPIEQRNWNDELPFDGQVGHWRLFDQLFALQMENTLANLSSVPLLHIHGTLDKVIPYSQAALWRQHRLEALADTKMVPLAHTDHNFTCLAERKLLLKETEQWFIETLQRAIAASPQLASMSEGAIANRRCSCHIR